MQNFKTKIQTQAKTSMMEAPFTPEKMMPSLMQALNIHKELKKLLHNHLIQSVTLFKMGKVVKNR